MGRIFDAIATDKQWRQRDGGRQTEQVRRTRGGLAVRGRSTEERHGGRRTRGRRRRKLDRVQDVLDRQGQNAPEQAQPRRTVVQDGRQAVATPGPVRAADRIGGGQAVVPAQAVPPSGPVVGGGRVVHVQATVPVQAVPTVRRRRRHVIRGGRGHVCGGLREHGRRGHGRRRHGRGLFVGALVGRQTAVPSQAVPPVRGRRVPERRDPTVSL